MGESNIHLTNQERDQLLSHIGGTYTTTILNRAHILLKRDEGKSQEEISRLLYIDREEVERTCDLFGREGIMSALFQRPHDVLRLRDAAYRQDWHSCEQISKLLFPLLKTRDIITIMVFHLIAFLPIFEQMHREIKWPRSFLLQFLEPQSSERVYNFPFYKELYTTAGTNGFLEAMAFLADIYQSRNNPSKYTFNLAVEGIAIVIQSKWLAAWAMEHSDKWEEWVKTNSKPIGVESALADEGASNSWITVADQVEKYLQTYSHTRE